MREENIPGRQPSLADTQPSRPSQNDSAGDARAHVENLLHRARTAPDTDQALEFIQRAVNLEPNDPRVLTGVQLSLFNKLRGDPFVAYLAESDGRYVVRFRNSRPLAVPTARNEQEYYPPPRRTEAEKAMSMMWWLLLGLVPAGLGAIVLSPVAIRHAIVALQQGRLSRPQHRMAWAAIFISLALGMLGVFFAALLLLHFFFG